MTARTDDGPVAGSAAKLPSAPPDSTKRGLGELFGGLLTRNVLLLTWVAVIVLFGVWVPDTFLTTINLQTILGSQAVLLILTLGLLPNLTVGIYDLSVAGTLGFSMVLVGKLNVEMAWPIGLAILVALAVGALIGLLNGVISVWLGVDSFVTTLGVGTALYGATLAVSNVPIAGIAKPLVEVAGTKLFGIQLAFYYGLAFTVVVWYVFRFTPLGRALFMTGANPDVARLAGIPVRRLKMGSLIFSGVVSAIAGVVLAGLLGSAEPNIGSTYLLPAFAGAFLGATSVTPGRFNAWGTFIAIYFLVTGITGLELVGQSGWITQVFYGGALVIAVVFARLVGLRRRTA